MPLFGATLRITDEVDGTEVDKVVDEVLKDVDEVVNDVHEDDASDVCIVVIVGIAVTSLSVRALIPQCMPLLLLCQRHVRGDLEALMESV